MKLRYPDGFEAGEAEILDAEFAYEENSRLRSGRIFNCEFVKFDNQFLKNSGERKFVKICKFVLKIFSLITDSCKMSAINFRNFGSLISDPGDFGRPNNIFRS